MRSDHPSMTHVSVWINDDAGVTRTFQDHLGDVRTILTWRTDDAGRELVQLWLTQDQAQDLWECLSTVVLGNQAREYLP